MTMALLVNNRSFSDLISITTTAAIDIFVRTFSFVMEPTEFHNARIGLGSSVVILADGEEVLTGFIDDFSDSYDRKSHTVTVTGRSKTADLVDSTIGPDINLSGETNMQKVAETLIKSLLAAPFPESFEGIRRTPRTINVVVDTQVVTDSLEDEAIKDEVGVTYFSILEKLARKRQVLVTDNGKGDVVITRGRGRLGASRTPFALQNITNGINNNVKSATQFRSDAERFSLYTAESQPIRYDISRIETIQPNGLIVSEGGITESGIRSSRKFVFIAESPSDGNDVQQRALWEANVRRARSIIYTAVTNGHSFGSGRRLGNLVWKPNFPIRVRDVKVNLNGRFLINTVTLSQSRTGGEETEIVCVPDFSYLPSAPVIGEIPEIDLDIV